MSRMNRVIGILCCCWTMGVWSAVPEEGPGCHPTPEESRAEKAEKEITARDGGRSNSERRYSRQNARRDNQDDGTTADRGDRDSNMERRYDRQRSKDLRDDNPDDITVENTPDPYFEGRTYLGSSPVEE